MTTTDDDGDDEEQIPDQHLPQGSIESTTNSSSIHSIDTLSMFALDIES
jgi:hypothetical protein